MEGVERHEGESLEYKWEIQSDGDEQMREVEEREGAGRQEWGVMMGVMGEGGVLGS